MFMNSKTSNIDGKIVGFEVKQKQKKKTKFKQGLQTGTGCS